MVESGGRFDIVARDHSGGDYSMGGGVPVRFANP
jgi:hypothetical protein